MLFLSDRVNNLVCGNLRIDLEQGTICYGNNNPIEISPSNNIVKFLVILMRGGKAIEYVEIAKQLEMNCWHEGATNKDVAREVQFLRRDLVAFLINKISIPQNEIKKMILSKPSFGYKLNCPDNSPKLH